MRNILMIMAISSVFVWCNASYATFSSGSTGTDGAFNPAANTVITLPPSGILNYTTVNIPAGVTVTFIKNAANTPVYMLATGDVIIAGTISANGTNATSTQIGKGGPGGFDGGYGGAFLTAGGRGMGPGGGGPGVYTTSATCGGGGGFSTVGYPGSWGNSGAGGPAYGNRRLLPLIGGSGGGGAAGSAGTAGTPGGGGGGAILIASSTTITILGSLTANGGNGGLPTQPGGGGGSGGSVKLVANQISGEGSITATKGNHGDCGGDGAAGFIRLESYANNRTGPTNPVYSYSNTPASVIPSAQPSLVINSFVASGNTYNVPASPTGSYTQPDLTLPSGTTSAVVNITAYNIPTSTQVIVRAIPQYGSDSSVNAASLSGTQQQATTSATLTTLSSTYSNVVTAEATFTIEAMYYNGEEIDRVHVATTLGGKSETTYITKSGKRIKGELIAAFMK